MTKETFIARLRKIEDQYKELSKKHDLMVEQNPFVEDGSGVMPEWLTNLITEHVITLFASVNENAFYKTRLDTCKGIYPGKSLEEIAMTVSGDDNIMVLAGEVKIKYECDCNKEKFERGLISIGKKKKKKMIEEDGKADTTCHFCNKKYHFSKEDLEKILNKLQDLN